LYTTISSENSLLTFWLDVVASAAWLGLDKHFSSFSALCFKNQYECKDHPGKKVASMNKVGSFMMLSSSTK
jgi:hypothetical protein